MQSRSPIRSDRARGVLRWGGVALMVFVGAACLFSWRVSWQTPPAGSSFSTRTLGVYRGSLWSSTARKPGTPDPARLGRWDHAFGVEPGLETSSFTHVIQNGGGGRGFESKQYGFAFVGVLVALGMIALTLPLVRPEEGECACGYDLAGVTGGVCPECGAPIGGAASGAA